MSDYSRIRWNNIPCGPEHVVARIVYAQRDHGPWWRRIWRGHWRRYETRSYTERGSAWLWNKPE